MATKKNTNESGNVKWTPEMLSYLAEHPTTPRTPLIEGFRAKFEDFTGSDQSVVGRRYRLLQDGSKAHPEIGLTALNVRIAELEDELADLKAKRDRMEAAADESTSDVPSVEEITALPMDEVRSLADRFGVKKSGGKQAIAERIHTQTA